MGTGAENKTRTRDARRKVFPARTVGEWQCQLRDVGQSAGRSIARAGRAQGARAFAAGGRRHYLGERVEGNCRGFGCGEAEKRSPADRSRRPSKTIRGMVDRWICQNCVTDEGWPFKAESTSPESRYSRDSLCCGASGNGGWRDGQSPWVQRVTAVRPCWS